MKASLTVFQGLTALCLTAALAAPALAFSIDPTNLNRQVAVNGPAAGEVALQTILDTQVSPGFDVANGQSTAGMWGAATLPIISSPIIVAEWAGQANSNTFGIWYGTDSTSIYSVQLFDGPSSANSSVTLTYSVNAAGRYELLVNGVSKGDDALGRINPFAFGFYLGAGADKFYSVDSLNQDGVAMMLAYQHPAFTDTWVFAAEDTLKGDRDFNDMVVKVESLRAVPEPASLLLLGNGLLAMGAWAMTRRKNQA